MEKDKRNQILKRIASISILILLIVLLAIISNVIDKNFEYIVDESKLQIIYFDVGQADSTLIMNNGKTTLIDGGNDSDGDNLVKYIKSQKLSKIDTVIATHLHADHIGGLDDIIDNFDIGTVYMPDTINTDKQVEEFLDVMERKNLNYEVPEVGEKFKNGLVDCEVMAIDNDAKDLNNSSIVIQMNYLEQSYLFMGDSEKEVENSRNWNKVNVLKVGHYGSNTSSTEKFLNQVKPEIAIISVGLNNQYKNPSVDVLNRLKNLYTTIYRTDENGSLLLESDGKQNTIKRIKTNNQNLYNF
ncbi:MAG: MBL fold metallo-hydrolase [Clostridia bacterium]|jgi:competence protein ComEC|nr:MBL fold metallo-hydrolase [Clostridia bacterium]